MTKNNREIPEKNVRNEIKKMKISHKSGINVKHMHRPTYHIKEHMRSITQSHTNFRLFSISCEQMQIAPNYYHFLFNSISWTCRQKFYFVRVLLLFYNRQ